MKHLFDRLFCNRNEISSRIVYENALGFGSFRMISKNVYSGFRTFNLFCESFVPTNLKSFKGLSKKSRVYFVLNFYFKILLLSVILGSSIVIECRTI